jgi:hypothetical protein
VLAFARWEGRRFYPVPVEVDILDDRALLDVVFVVVDDPEDLQRRRNRSALSACQAQLAKSNNGFAILARSRFQFHGSKSSAVNPLRDS